MSNFINKFLNDKLKDKSKINSKKDCIDNKEKLKNKNIIVNLSNANLQEKNFIIKSNYIDNNKLNVDNNKLNVDNNKLNVDNNKLNVDNNKLNVDNNTKKNEYKTKEIEKLVMKQLSWYLWNDFNLDNTMNNMINEIKKDWDNEKTINSSKKSDKMVIEIQKEKPYKNLLLIFIEFLIWIILIVVSVISINNNVAEYKFVKSSIYLWINTFNGIFSKIKGIIWEDARKKYIQKRDDLVSELISFENKLKSCNKKWIDDIEYRIENLKILLMNTNYLSLDEFINNYDKYKIDVDAIKASISLFCK